MPQNVRHTLDQKQLPQNTAEEQVPFVCGCKLSARFIPLYRFNRSGVVPQILMMPPATMKCSACDQLYRWVPPSTPDGRDGGWQKTSSLDDLDAL